MFLTVSMRRLSVVDSCAEVVQQNLLSGIDCLMHKMGTAIPMIIIGFGRLTYSLAHFYSGVSRDIEEHSWPMQAIDESHSQDMPDNDSKALVFSFYESLGKCFIKQTKVWKNTIAACQGLLLIFSGLFWIRPGDLALPHLCLDRSILSQDFEPTYFDAPQLR